MKKVNIFKRSFVALSMATMVLATSCSDDENPTPKPPSGTEEELISGEIAENMTLKAGVSYTLAGGVHVKAGTTLTIEPGVIVKSKVGEAIAYLLVEQGAKIVADGTADRQIIFTSGEATPKRGDWGGIIICGDAPINGGDGNGERTAEVGDVKYGGTNVADNSGILKYVTVKYTGNAINDEKEHNGFTFNGVGNGTILNGLHSDMGGDDAFEFFGGTVNAENLLATGAKDDSFDWTYGWNGTGTNWKAIQADDAGDRGIEGDNNSKDFAATPVSNPTLNGVTLIGNGQTKEGKGIAGVKLRAGTNATITNLRVENFTGSGVEIETDESVQFVLDGDLTVKANLSKTANGFKIKKELTEAEQTKVNESLKNDISLTGADDSRLPAEVKDPTFTVPTVVSGEITGDVIFKSGETYELAGGVHVKAGATLTIESGVTVKNKVGEAIAYLLIEQGAKIMAEGTADAPIVFTSGEATPKRGDWGGIIICGDAPINGGDTNGERTAEVGDVKYGGNNAADNSGVLKFVRVEYTGNAINDEKEHNGFTFNGVGSGTVVENIQAYMGGDDGFEFFGGSVNVTNAISSGSKDDSFDWTYGWNGNGTNWLAVQAEDTGDRGIEGDNNSKDFGATPTSNPMLTDITLIGNGLSKEGKGLNGVKLRAGTKGKITNLVVKGFSGEALALETTETVEALKAGDVMITNYKSEGNAADYKLKNTTGDEAEYTTNLIKSDDATGSSLTGDESWARSL